MSIDHLLLSDPGLWVDELPDFQRDPIKQLLASGESFDGAAQAWITATTANTFHFSAGAPVGNKADFLKNLQAEVKLFLCGDKKYQAERNGLFGKQGLARTYVVSALAVAISAHLSVAAAVIAPAIALTLASIGKITLNAWCALP